MSEYEKDCSFVVIGNLNNFVKDIKINGKDTLVITPNTPFNVYVYTQKNYTSYDLDATLMYATKENNVYKTVGVLKNGKLKSDSSEIVFEDVSITNQGSYFLYVSFNVPISNNYMQVSIEKYAPINITWQVLKLTYKRQDKYVVGEEITFYVSTISYLDDSIIENLNQTLNVYADNVLTGTVKLSKGQGSFTLKFGATGTHSVYVVSENTKIMSNYAYINIQNPTLIHNSCREDWYPFCFLKVILDDFKAAIGKGQNSIGGD